MIQTRVPRSSGLTVPALRNTGNGTASNPRCSLAGDYMEAINSTGRGGLREARRRLASLIEISRWVWVINAVVTMIGLYYGRYDIAALAGFTWALVMMATGMGHRVAINLREESRTGPGDTQPS
jgi:hypothetical protein